MGCLYKEDVDRIFTLDEPCEEMGSEATEVPTLKEEEFAQIVVLGLCVLFPNGEALSFRHGNSLLRGVPVVLTVLFDTRLLMDGGQFLDSPKGPTWEAILGPWQLGSFRLNAVGWLTTVDFDGCKGSALSTLLNDLEPDLRNVTFVEKTSVLTKSSSFSVELEIHKLNFKTFFMSSLCLS
ncbi:hypothetical protein Tco_0383117 [Tanacetum coccineum]